MVGSNQLWPPYYTRKPTPTTLWSLSYIHPTFGRPTSTCLLLRPPPPSHHHHHQPTQGIGGLATGALMAWATPGCPWGLGVNAIWRAATNLSPCFLSCYPQHTHAAKIILRSSSGTWFRDSFTRDSLATAHATGSPASRSQSLMEVT
jgi:hypothetical protein